MFKYKPSKYSLFLIPALLLMVSTGGFAAPQDEIKGEKNLQEDIAKTKKTESKEDLRDYIYDPTNKTDPFRSFISIREEKAQEEREKPKTYLETLELSQLSLTAIVIGDKGKWAMVKDSKDLGHVIKEGTPIGTNGGVVYRIKEGEVIIREMEKDFRGNLKPKDIIKKSPSE
jgi:Tfp pilus assembly protein PilP